MHSQKSKVEGLIPEGVDNLDRHMSLYVPTDKRSIIYNEYYGDNESGSTRRYDFGSGGLVDDPKLLLQSSGLWSAINSGSNIDTSGITLVTILCKSKFILDRRGEMLYTCKS